MARRLPPFASVRAFEAAARYCNFKRAGEELSITPSAISHQVKSLEDFLGRPLFNRHQSNLVLTDTGTQYLLELSKILDRLDAATQRAISPEDKTDISISLLQSFASNWLVTRIPALRAAHPDINVRLITATSSLEMARQEIDFSIMYLKLDDVGEQIKPAFEARLLFRESITPVCNPAFARELGQDVTTGDILQQSLIFCDTEPNEWELWCETLGVPYQETARRINLDNRMLALKAAVDGLGIAMGRTPFHDDDVANGNLVAPLSTEISTGYGYFLVYAKRKSRIGSMRRFREWIIETCAEHKNDLSS